MLLMYSISSCHSAWSSQHLSLVPQLGGDTISHSVQPQSNGKNFLRVGAGLQVTSALANQNGRGLTLWVEEQVVETVPVHTSSFSFHQKDPASPLPSAGHSLWTVLSPEWCPGTIQNSARPNHAKVYQTHSCVFRRL